MQAAYAVAAWLQRADLNGSLRPFFCPPLSATERERARSKAGYSAWFERERQCTALALSRRPLRVGLKYTLTGHDGTDRASLGISEAQPGGLAALATRNFDDHLAVGHRSSIAFMISSA
jgi:hypothetical protein